MEMLRVKDNSQHLKATFNAVSGITQRVADKTLAQLEKEGVFVFPEMVSDAEDLSRDQMILKSVNGRYATSNVMGFLGYGHERLIIASRFSTAGQDYFLQYMLEKVIGMPNVLNLDTNANRENQLFNLLLFMFPYYLKRAMRKGIFKTYINKKYNDANPKGTLDVARHIKENTPFIGNIAYTKRELSYDNDVMELIRHTIEFIKHKPHGDTLLGKVKDEVEKVTCVTNGYSHKDKTKVLRQNKKKPIRHAYYHEYRSLQKLCIMILEQEKHQFGTGIRKVHGILFDGAWLWEEYVNTLIEDKFYHPMNKGGKGAQKLFTTSNGQTGLIYPDFISKDSENRIVADTKYKPIENIGNRDYLQVLAYMFRFDAAKGYYLYPNNSDEADLQMNLNQGSSYEKNIAAREDISVTKCGLTIPRDAESFEDFVFRLVQNESEFLEKFIGKRKE